VQSQAILSVDGKVASKLREKTRITWYHIMLGIDRIQRELKVIGRIDEMFRQKKDHSPSDLVRFQARQSRRQELIEMLQEVEPKLSPVIASARKKQNPLDKARVDEAFTNKSRAN
jgi:hypothetical protein